MHFYLWFVLLSIDIFFRHISSLPKRTRLSVFVTFISLLSSRRLWQQHPTKRLCRRATAEPHWETLSLSPFSFSPRRAKERVVGKSSESRRIRRDISKYNNGRRTKNDGQRSRERGGRRRRRDRASSGEGNNTTFIKASSSFFSLLMIKRRNKANRVCVFVVHRPKSRFERVPSRGMPFEI